MQACRHAGWTWESQSETLLDFRTLIWDFCGTAVVSHVELSEEIPEESDSAVSADFISFFE